MSFSSSKGKLPAKRRPPPLTTTTRVDTQEPVVVSPTLINVQSIGQFQSTASLIQTPIRAPDYHLSRTSKKRSEVKFILQEQNFNEIEEVKQYDSQIEPERVQFDSEMIPHSPFTSLEKEISKANPSAITENVSLQPSKFLKSSSTVITLPRQLPDPSLPALEKQLFSLVVQLSILIKTNHFNIDVIQEYYPLRELIKQESRIPKSELSVLKVNVLRLLRKNPQVEKEFKIWKQYLAFLNQICGKWGLIKVDDFQHRIDPKLQTIVRIISYRNLNRHYIGLETLWLTCLTSPLKFIINKELSAKAVALRTSFLQFALHLVQDYTNTSDLRKAIHDFEQVRFRKQDSVIRNEKRESIVLKTQPILYPQKRSSYMSLDLETAEDKANRANQSKLAAWFKKPTKSEQALIKWRDELESFVCKFVDFERTFMAELYTFVAPKSKAYLSQLSQKKAPSAVNSNAKYSIASQLGLKGKNRKFSGNESTVPDSQFYVGSGPPTPMNLTPRSEVKNNIFFQAQSSATSSEMAHISQMLHRGGLGGQLSPAQEDEENNEETEPNELRLDDSVKKELNF